MTQGNFFKCFTYQIHYEFSTVDWVLTFEHTNLIIIVPRMCAKPFWKNKAP
jgi:hypothetical protein